MLANMSEPTAITRSLHGPRPRGPRRLPPWARRISTIAVWMIVVFLVVYFFNAISTVLLGVLAAAIVASTLHPLLRVIPGPRGVAAGVLGLSLIVLVAGLVLGLSMPLAKPIQQRLGKWNDTAVTIDKFLAEKSAKFGLADHPLSVSEIFKTVGNFLTGSGGQQFFSRSADVTFGILLWLVFIFIGSIFLLTEPPDALIIPASRLLPLRLRAKMHRMLYDLGPRLRRWVIATFLSMSIVFTASVIGYSIVGLQFVVPLALLAAMCEIVPTVGPAVAAVVASLFAAATSGGAAVAGVLIVYGVIQSVEAYVILPMIMRGAVKIHPAVTLFSIVLWGKIFGVPGLMLAIPINLTLWAAAEEFLIDQRGEPPASLPVADPISPTDSVHRRAG